MNIETVPISSTIEEKINWSNLCYRRFGREILEDRTIVDLIAKLTSAVSVSHAEMTKTGIVDLCRQCEQEEGGSCCGYGMEKKYDGWLLLINLLMDVKLPKTREDKKSCFFLGETGCLLEARHVICINYICGKITRQIDPGKISVLRENEGKEITLVFLLNERIKRLVRSTAKRTHDG